MTLDDLWSHLNGLVMSDLGFSFFLGFLAGYIVKAIRI